MKKKIVSFQGIDGAYSDLVCRKYYRTYKTLPCETFQKTLDAVSKGVANLALIPVENNIAGRVADMHLLLEKIELKIVAEHYHKVEHHLISKKDVSLKNINKVYKTIKDLHNYEIPEISTIQTSKVDKNYENWLKDFVER